MRPCQRRTEPRARADEPRGHWSTFAELCTKAAACSTAEICEQKQNAALAEFGSRQARCGSYAEKCQARDAELQGLRVQLQQAHEDLLDCRCQLDETFQENEEEIEAFRMKAEGALRSSLSLKDAEIEELLRTKDRFYSEALQDKDEQILKMKSGVHELILRRAVSRMIHRNLWHSFAHWHGMCQEAKKLRLVLGRSLGRWSNRRIARTFQAWMQFVAARKHQSLAEMLEDLEEQRLSDEELVMKAHEALAAKAEELEQCVSLRQKDEQLLLKAHAALAEKDAEIARLCGVCHG